LNYYRRYVGDYLRDTSRLSMLEHGAYTLLLDHYYAEELPIPLDMQEVYTMVRAMTPADRKAVDKVLERYFTAQPDGFHNARADKEISVSKQARDNGKGGGRPKTGTGTGTQTGTGTGQGGEDSTGQGGGSGHPPTTILQPPASDPPATDPPTPKKSKGAGSAFAAPEWIPSESWIAFEQMRTKARKPMTDRARELIVKELESLQSKGFDPVAVLDQSIRNNWQDVFPLKDKGGSAGQSLSSFMAERDSKRATS
jgi:uncharacterized protein YdaU (DUF1376 family)